MRAAELSLEEALHPLGVIKSVVDEVVVVQSHQAAPIMNDDSGNPSTNLSCCHYPEHYQLTFLGPSCLVSLIAAAHISHRGSVGCCCFAVLALEGRRVLGPIAEIFGRTDAPMYTGTQLLLLLLRLLSPALAAATFLLCTTLIRWLCDLAMVCSSVRLG